MQNRSAPQIRSLGSDGGSTVVDRANNEHETERMLFLTHWKLNEGLSTRETNDIATELTEGGLFPPEDAEIIRWDATPDGWGIVLWEAESYEAINNGLNVWRAAAGETAFFEKTKTAPAAPVEEVIPQQAAFLEQLE